MSTKQHQVDALLFGVGAYASDQRIPKSDIDRMLVLIRAAMPISASDADMAANTVSARRAIRAQVDTYRASIVAMVMAQKISIEMGAELEGLTVAIMRDGHDGAA